MKHLFPSFLVTTFFGAAGALSMACSATDTTSTTADALTAVESDLDSADESEATAGATASACLDTFKTCNDAEGADKEACKTSLDACLPDDAPPPKNCGGGGGGGKHGHGKGGKHGPPPDGADGGARPPKGEHVEGDGGKRGGGDCDKEKPACEKPPVSQEAIRACKDQAAAQAASSTDSVDACKKSHHSCVGNEFKKAKKDLCNEGTTLCGAADAPADQCARVKTRCEPIVAETPAEAPVAEESVVTTQ
ncbi:MAG: hypothetical protein KBF88_05180 [Polyangiaceae bacterium]|nr:hypothetical protein [Polyangiaceae bacterium]